MPEIARLRIELDGVRPRVVRRLEVPIDVRLDDLHLVFQAAMGWENYHLFEFRAGRAAWGEPDPEWDSPGSGPLPAKKATIADLLGHGREGFKYFYDFGDDWQHTVTLEAVAEAVPDVAYPRLLAAEGADARRRMWAARGATQPTSKPSRIPTTSATAR
jgi:Plasmid pRiA4b ORF-3-like protein